MFNHDDVFALVTMWLGLMFMIVWWSIKIAQELRNLRSRTRQYRLRVAEIYGAMARKERGEPGAGTR
jgi:hypothetical protein